MNKKVIIIHPGVHHAYRLANALLDTGFFSKVILCTWLLLKVDSVFAQLPFFKKRVKEIDKKIHLHVFPFFEGLQYLNEKIFFFLFPQKKNTNYNNIQYIWAYVFGLFLLPYLYFNRRGTLLILYDACGWPLSYFARKWGIPVIMDFPSISHESALSLGIEETKLGIKFKEKERQHIDFALFCSDFALATYANKTSSKGSYTAHVGAALLTNHRKQPINYESNSLNIAFIANLEYRKGLDLLLYALEQINIPYNLHIIGKISKSWVFNILKNSNKVINNVQFAGAFDQKSLVEYLQSQNIQLHILPSRFDSFGMVVPETMMLGIPSIVSPFVGAGEKIENGKDGFILDKLDVVVLSKSIENFYKLDKNAKETLSRKAFEKSKEISWDNYDQKIKLIFNHILEKVETKIAFVVTHPTQFEVPFFKYISSKKDDIKFDVLYINTSKDLHYDKEIGRKVDWGFDLFQGYNYYIVHNRSEFKKLLKLNRYNLIITNGYNGKYLNILDIMLFYSNKLALRIDSILKNQPFAWKLWKRPILKIIFKIFNHYFVVGTQSKNYLLALGKDLEDIHLFSYSIDQSKFENIDTIELNNLKLNLNIKSNQKVFLCVAKLVERESPIDVIKAFINCNQPNWRLLIIGDGKFKKDLERYCKQTPVDAILFLGYIDYVNLPLYYHLSDVFIHSTKEENWGVSVHEAIACNCTVIASDTVGSATDLISEGKNGFTYPFKNIPVLQQKMKDSLELDPLQKKSTNRTILKEWGYEKMWNEIRSTTN